MSKLCNHIQLLATRMYVIGLRRGVRDRISDSEKSQFYYPSAGLGTIPNYYVA